MTTSCNLIQESNKPVTKPKFTGDICTIKSDEKGSYAFCTLMGRPLTDQEFISYVSTKEDVLDLYTDKRVYKSGFNDLNKFKCMPYKMWYSVRDYINN